MGTPLRECSTECIRTAYRLTGGIVPSIGVGRVGSGKDAYKKLQVRALAVQVYNMSVYEGPGLASCTRKEMVDLLAKNRYRSMEDTVRADHEDIYWRSGEENALGWRGWECGRGDPGFGCWCCRDGARASEEGNCCAEDGGSAE